MARRVFALVLPVVGFGFVGASVSILSSLATAFDSGALLSSSSFYLALGSVGFSMLIVVFREKLAPLSERTLMTMGTTVIGMISTVILLVSLERMSPSSLAVSCVGFLILGGVHAYLTCAWLELYVRMIPRDAAVSICLSHLVLAIAGFLIVWLCLTQASRIVAVLVMLSFNMAFYGGSVSFFSHEVTTGEEISSDWSFPTKPVLLVAIFAFTSVIGRAGIGPAFSNYPRWAVVVICLCAAVYAKIKYEHMDPRLFADLALVFALAGILLRFASGDAMMLASSFFTNAAFALFYIFVYISLCRMSYRYGTSPLLLFGTTYAAIRAAYWIAGICGARAYAASPQVFMYVASLTMLALVSVFLLCMRSPSTLETWGIEPGDTLAGRSLASSAEAKQDRDARIARRYNLTHREEEIMSLLADGDSLVQIEKELFISHATVKTHTQHIYEKMGVHSKRELEETVANYKMN